MMPRGCFREERALSRRMGAPSAALTQGARAGVEVDNLHLLGGWRVHQRGNGCVAAAFAHALRGAAGRMGRRIDPSWTALYGVLRNLERPGAERLPDGGGFLHRGAQAFLDWGVCSRVRWPDDVDLELPVPVDVLEAGRVARAGGVYPIVDEDPIEEIERLLNAGHFVVFGAQYGARFDLGPGASPYDGEAVADDQIGHATCIVGTSPGYKRIVNSWGAWWNGDGTAWLTDRFIRTRAWGLYAVTIAPAEVV